MRNTGLSMNKVEDGILNHLGSQLNNGGTLPQVGTSGFRGPANYTTTINGVKVGYRAVKLSDGTISIGTYWPN